MLVVDPETYLRCCAEDLLVPGHQAVFDGELELAVRADTLRAGGALDAALVDRILAAYLSAARLRGLEYAEYAASGSRARSAAAWRWVRVRGKIALASGTLRLTGVVLDDDRVRLSGTLRFAPPQQPPGAGSSAPGPGRRWPPHFHPGPPSLKLTDDHGSTATAHFSGSGSSNDVHGHWTTDRGLHADTRHLLIDGVRVELIDVPPARVAVEPVTDLDPVEHQLRQVLLRQAVDQHGASMERFEVVLDTLIQVGAVGPDDAAAVSARAAHTALANAAEGRAPSASELAALDGLWRSALSRLHARSGRRATVTIAADVEVDGVRVLLHNAKLTDGTVHVDFEADHDGHLHRGPPLQLTVRAVDDLGNHYLSRLEGWETHEEGRVAGQLALWPVVHDAARALSVVVAGDTEQATVRIDLPGTSS